MKNLKRLFVIGLVFCVLGVTSALIAPAGQAVAATTTTTTGCGGGDFLGFPKWYKYLDSQTYTDDVTGAQNCVPRINGINDIWRIVAAVIELMLRLSALVAIGFIVYGGITYTLSQASPDKTKQALKTIISALVGLVIAIIATGLVTFIAGRFNS